MDHATALERLYEARSENDQLHKRIDELEAALRDLIGKIDPIYDLEPEDRHAYDKAKSVLERK